MVMDELVFNAPPSQIRTWPDDLSLRLVSNEITEWDDPDETLPPLKQLVQQMATTMYAHEGAGLAAPQVGTQRRLIVLRDDPPKNSKRRGISCFAMCNPRILDQSEEDVEDEEGCLSLPGIRVAVWRPEAILVEHETTLGATVQIEAFGHEARVIQHEIDHLDGKLIVDYLEVGDRRRAVTALAMMAARNRVEEYTAQKAMYDRLAAARAAA